MQTDDEHAHVAMITRLWRERDRALESFFGQMCPSVLVGSEGWAIGGSPTVNVYRDQTDRVTCCTSDLTTPYGDAPEDFELHLVVRPDTWAASGESPPAGGLLMEVAKSTRNAKYDAGHMLGPLHERWAPLTRLYFLESTNRFWVGTRHCRLLLLFGIHESEHALWKQPGGPDELLAKLAAAECLPFTDPGRAPVA
jgi:hypothetical protein